MDADPTLLGEGPPTSPAATVQYKDDTDDVRKQFTGQIQHKCNYVSYWAITAGGNTTSSITKASSIFIYSQTSSLLLNYTIHVVLRIFCM